MWRYNRSHLTLERTLAEGVRLTALFGILGFGIMLYPMSEFNDF